MRGLKGEVPAAPDRGRRQKRFAKFGSVSTYPFPLEAINHAAATRWCWLQNVRTTDSN